VVHRDIKPSNVVLDRRGKPILIDFGIAQDVTEDRLTGTGLVAGTPGFVSPDLLRGGDPSPDSDRWAAAALLLGAATGRQPFGTGPVETVLSRVLEGQADLDGLPDHLARAFAAALHPSPAMRPTLGELAAAIDPPEAPDEVLAPTRVSPVLPGEEPDGATEHLWTEPPVVDYRQWVDSATGGSIPSYPATPLDDDVYPGADAPGGPFPPAPPAARVVVLAGWLCLSALAAHWPAVAAVVAGCALVGGRTVWMALTSLTARRWRRGTRPSDRTRLAFGMPWHFLRGLLGSTPALALGALVGVTAYLAAAHWFRLAPPALAAVGVLSVGVGLALAWWGPSATETRFGVRAVIAAALPGRLARALVTLGLVAGAAALAAWAL
jgi:hypothetical protein